MIHIILTILYLPYIMIQSSHCLVRCLVCFDQRVELDFSVEHHDELVDVV